MKKSTAVRKPKAPKGQIVSLPKSIVTVGWGLILLTLGMAVWAYTDGERDVACLFLALSLIGAAFIMAYRNCRITYDETGFTATSFWGIARSYTYDNIIWRKGTKDVKLYVDGRVVRIDDMAVGKTEFLWYAEARYMRTHGGRGIPITPPDGTRHFDLFNGNVENEEEFIIVYALLLGFVLFAMGIVIHAAIPTKAEDLTYSTIRVDRYAVEEDTLLLYAEGEELPFDIWDYSTALSDADAFLRLCDDGEGITVGYRSFSEHHIVHCAEGADGTVYLTMEAAREAERENDKETILIMGGMALFLILFIAASICVGRHPERFGPRIVGFFFKEGYVHSPVNKKR